MDQNVTFNFAVASVNPTSTPFQTNNYWRASGTLAPKPFRRGQPIWALKDLSGASPFRPCETSPLGSFGASEG